MKLDFGTYAGFELQDIPTDYLQRHYQHWPVHMHSEIERELVNRDREDDNKEFDKIVGKI